MESFGSRSIVPTALLRNVFETNTQNGSGESGLSVRQIPPPAAAIHSRHRDGVQVGVMASAVTRPAMWNCAPLKLRIPGCVPCVGPIMSQTNGSLALLPPFVPSLFSPYVLKVFCAFAVALRGIVPSGNARLANFSSAALPGVAPVSSSSASGLTVIRGDRAYLAVRRVALHEPLVARGWIVADLNCLAAEISGNENSKQCDDSVVIRRSTQAQCWHELPPVRLQRFEFENADLKNEAA